MMNITKFGIQNFRVFKEHFDFDLAPIMVLTGPNNSGKSSLTKALLLLKENEDKINADEHYFSTKINYFEGEHELGNHKLTVNTKDENTYFSFTFFLEYKFVIGINNKGEFTGDYIISTGQNDFIIFQSGCDITINVQNIIKYFIDRIHNNQSEESNTIMDSNVDIQKINKLITRLEDFGEKIHTIVVDVFLDSPLWAKLKYQNEPPSFEENLEKGIYSPLYFDPDPDFELLDTNRQENLTFLFYKITSIKLTREEVHFLLPTSINKWESNDIFFQFSDIIYINTIKESIKRAYSKNDTSVIKSIIMDRIQRHMGDVAHNDDNLLKYQISIKRKIVHDGRFEFMNRMFEEINQFERKWLKEFEIGEELSYGYDEKNDIFFIKVDNKSLLEYGLGLSSIVRILLATSFKKNSIERNSSKNVFLLRFPSTMIIEEPETGLHPAFQSKMADMIVDIQKTFNINLIIETHSEYFIRKLQYLTAIKEINPGDAVIYYFNNPKKIPENEEQIKNITIAKDGSLSDNFGPGFIDEATNLKFDLLRLAKNQKN